MPGPLLNQFQQNSARRGRVHEDIQVPACALARLVEKARARRLEFLDRRTEVRDLQRDMVQSFAPLL
jgi:hypothetical protein